MTDELMTTAKAAEYLAGQDAGKTMQAWVTWLRNSRSPNRKVAFRIEPQKVGNDLFWPRSELDKLVAFEKSRQVGHVKLTGRAAEAFAAFGFNQGGGAYGRKWQGASANLGITNEGERFVQALIKEPMMVFQMTPEQAVSFAKELQEAAQAATRQNASANTTVDMSVDETIDDNKDALIQRRIIK